jgi:cyclic peptide transporter
MRYLLKKSSIYYCLLLFCQLLNMVIRFSRLLCLLFLFYWPLHSFPQTGSGEIPIARIDKEIGRIMEDGHIPGLTLVLIRGDQQLIRTYGYADLEKRTPVTAATLFQLGSCSKAFTALAVMQLLNTGVLRTDALVTDYIPWFHAEYKGKPAAITLLQLLHHTSGIPWQTIAGIPETNKADALEQTVRKLSGITLHHLPGKEFEYATVNYDILAYIVEKVTGEPFEDYMQEHVLNSLHLTNTTIGDPKDSSLLATGYKDGFFRPRVYKAPVFKGNNAAGYIISDGRDMARWVALQMGLTDLAGSTERIGLSDHMGSADSAIYALIKSTQQRDETVPPLDNNSYAMGWEVSVSGNGEIFHDGLNPNYTSYIAMRPKIKTGVAVMVNSNSGYTDLAGRTVMKILAGEELTKGVQPDDNNDKAYSIVCVILGIYILVVIAFLVLVMGGIIRKERPYHALSAKDLGWFLLALAAIAPFLYGIYLLPTAIANFTWDAILVWTPVSFEILVTLILLAIGITYFAYFISLLFPEPNTFKRRAPPILLMSILSGLANMAIIILITSSINSSISWKYLLFYYTLTLGVYILGRRFVQINLITFSRGIVYDLQIKLIERIFSTSYQKFEKIDRGRVYTALNDDVNFIGDSTNMLILMVTSIITTIGAFLYLASIAFWATLLTILLVLTISTLFYLVSRTTNIFFEQARDTRDVFMSHINGMIDGFKEISLHRNKKLEFRSDVAFSADKYRNKISTANIRFVNAFLVGESLLVVLLGTVVFAVPKLFPGIQLYTIMSFVIILLYLMKPITDILGAIPTVIQLKIAWTRIRQFLKEIPANLDLEKIPKLVEGRVESIRAEGIRFEYRNSNEQDVFSVGPIDLEVKCGEILFIIGGNGSGKTTLAKLLTGLYEPDEGRILINGEAIKSAHLGEYFSTVFSPAYLFEKLYNIDIRRKGEEVKKFLALLNLEDKVRIEEDKYSTIDLSGGQRKRLALLQCYMEDSPIYLFDEWAADQDPDYRNFFYRTLLPEMKKAGKIVIAITHDDHYFDVADKVLKMKQGRLEAYMDEYSRASVRSADNQPDLYEIQ